MLGISVNGEFLELSPRTTAQLERASPFFNQDDLAEEYSLPFLFDYTPRNARLLGLQNHFYTRREKKKIEAKLYDNNNFSYTGYLIIEAADLNVNDVTKSRISGYFLSGVSSFFQQVKNKKLRELVLGGKRKFVWTNNNPNSANVGFWQHIHTTLSGDKEYSFAPIRNSMWAGSDDNGTPSWMNKPDEDGNISYDDNFTTLAPQVSLKYVLIKIFEEHGWVFDYSLMGDLQWESLYMPSFYSVNWQKIVIVGPDFAYSPLPNIEINLQNHVPPEVYIQNLIIALRNRYNWGFEFDSGNKVCSMFPLKNLSNGVNKDWTKFLLSELQSSFGEDQKVFAFKNEIDSNDALSSSPDFTKAAFEDPVEEYLDLPAPAEALFNHVVYVWKLNQYFQCIFNETDNVYEWGIFGDNIYNYEPPSYNSEITTEASTMPVYRTLWRNNGATDFFGLFPLCEQEGNWEGKQGEFVPWGIRLLFHRGRVYEANTLGNPGTVQYPYLTSICFTPTQTEPDLDWSNVYVHEFQGIEKGIIDYWFRATLDYRKQADVTTAILKLSRTELVNYKWSDRILLKNIPFIGNKIIEVIPYDGTVKMELRRIG